MQTFVHFMHFIDIGIVGHCFVCVCLSPAFFFTPFLRLIFLSSNNTGETHNIDLTATQNPPEILGANDLVLHHTVKVRIALAKGVSQVFYKTGNYKKSVLQILLSL